MKNKDKCVSLFILNLKYEIISVIYKLYFLNKYYITLYELTMLYLRRLIFNFEIGMKEKR